MRFFFCEILWLGWNILVFSGNLVGWLLFFKSHPYFRIIFCFSSKVKKETIEKSCKVMTFISLRGGIDSPSK